MPRAPAKYTPPRRRRKQVSRALTQAVARMTLSGKARPAGPRQRRLKRVRKPPVGGASTAAGLHPAYDSRTWVPRSLRMTPTLRIKETQTFTLNANAAGSTVLLLGPCTGQTTLHDSSLTLANFGCYGTGAQVPFSTTTQIVPSVANSMGALGGRGRVHRYGVSVGCTGPTAGALLFPTSYVKAGMLRTVIEVGTLPVMSGIATFLDTRPEFHMRTGSELQHAPMHFSARPLDFTTWGELVPFTGSTGADFFDSMTTFAAVFSATAGLDLYIVTIHIEWDFLIADDSAVPLSSAHVQHPVMAEAAVDVMAGAALASSGLIQKGMGMLSAVSRAAPALADLEPLIGLI